ncbi:MAG: hypothetical protein KDI79_07840 [Anaerolineae bacterium]|nr:hypothetical protein [Anaerolineae bacterium]
MSEQHDLLEMAQKQLVLAGKTLVDDITNEPIVSNYPDLEKITSDWIDSFKQEIDKFSQQISSLTVPKSELRQLVDYGDLLYNFTETIVIYYTALQQQQQTPTLLPGGNSQDTQQKIQVAQTVANKLYAVIKDKGLNLYEPNYTALRVIPFINRLYAGGSDSALPYIVAPRWGYTQAWAWPGYAHEVGHHIYRNVIGLREELQAKLTTALVLHSYDYVHLNMWFSWMEEIFADLFGLLQIGPSFIRSQQYITLTSLRGEAMTRLHRGQDARVAFFHATDNAHPVPYLRVYLSLKALTLLGQDMTALEKQWEAFFEPVQASLGWMRADVTKMTGKRKLAWGVRSHEVKEKAVLFLSLILHIPLDALAGPDGQPRSIHKLFYDPTQQDTMKNAIDRCKAVINNPSLDNVYHQLITSDIFQNNPDIRTVIAVAEYAFEHLEIEQFQAFNKALFDFIQKQSQHLPAV